MTSDEVIRQLLELHRPPEWATFAELANGTGGHKSRTIDLYALNVWPSSGFQALAYEVKISRADFRRELDDPTKRAPWEALATETWYAAPSGVIPVSEVPEGWGLAEWTGTAWKRPRRALQRAIETFPRSFTASLARRSADPPPKAPAETWELLGRPIRLEDLVSLADKLTAHRHRHGIPVPALGRAPRPAPSEWETQAALREREDRLRLGGLARALERIAGRRVRTAEDLAAWWAGVQAGATPEAVDALRTARASLSAALELLDPGEAAEAAAERAGHLPPARVARAFPRTTP